MTGTYFDTCICKTCGRQAPSIPTIGTNKATLGKVTGYLPADGWFSWNYCTHECRREAASHE